MSLNCALLKKSPHKLALIDVQFLENVNTHYLWHVLFMWQPLNVKKRGESFQRSLKLCFFCLQDGKSHGLCVSGKPSAIFLYEEVEEF